MKVNFPGMSYQKEIKSLKEKIKEYEQVIFAVQNKQAFAVRLEGFSENKIIPLINTNQNYQLLLESMNEGAATLSTLGVIYYCNKRFSEMLEISNDEIIGSSIYTYIKSEDALNFNKILKLGKEIKKSEVFMLKTKKNQFISLNLSLTSYELKGVDVISLVATDLTLENVRLKESEILAKKLELAIKSKDEFISIASHELKTPLTSLLLQAQIQSRLILRNDPKAFDEIRIKLSAQQVEQLVLKLNRLIDDMLDISRINSGKLSFKKEKMDLEKLTLNIIERMKPQFLSAKYLEVKVSTSEAIGIWDSQRIEQVIVNLLSNSIKYGAGKQVSVSLSVKNKMARFSVSDLGGGITKEDQSKIFGRFQRIGDVTKVEGLGLGLYIAQQIIEAHNGKIWVESEPGKGSTFIFEIPTE